MSDLTTAARPLVTERLFELTLLAAALFETAHLLGLFGRRAEVDGTPLAIAFTFGVPWLMPLLGLAITRTGSVTAKWVLVVLGAIALLTAVRVGPGRWNEPAILLGAIAGVLQIAAIAMLFTPAGRRWTS
ncbi:hypothetical protein ASE86_04095 [Sphingomonas sp. Leaf33]|uniref:hypothetical protein n=1 Tax=Sphingomonas sp. Leaf33 TaxID=1736215 RepID=UPI0006FD17CC|nr:hypothetical protein [Sphingomonas sp. Leaf33]KQN25429.1 hypothetical protein ASE86_04095 [Sphingomonas sp. Leaf33]